MDLAGVAAMTGPAVLSSSSHQTESATPAALERVAPRALAQQAGAMMGLSPVARRAQAAISQVAAQAGTFDAEGGSHLAAEKATPAGAVHQRGLRITSSLQVPVAGGPCKVNSPTYRAAVAGFSSDPESSAMGAARGEQRDQENKDAALARQIESQEERALEEQVTSTSRDAELAMLLVAENAL
jgi:hypothetical protein